MASYAMLHGLGVWIFFWIGFRMRWMGEDEATARARAAEIGGSVG